MQMMRLDDARVRVTRRSPLTGQNNTMELPMTRQQWQTWCDPGLAQNRAPHLSPDQREFLMSGYTPEDWVAMFPPEEDEE